MQLTCTALSWYVTSEISSVYNIEFLQTFLGVQDNVDSHGIDVSLGMAYSYVVVGQVLS